MTIVHEYGVVAPSSTSKTALRPLPLGAIKLRPGFWDERQRVNRENSIPQGIDRLRAAGNFDNFRLIADRVAGEHGHAQAADSDVKNFVDSDIYKWLEAVGWEGADTALPPEIEDQAEEAIDLILRAQDTDGYLNTWYQTQDKSKRFSNMSFGHELYCLGHLIQAAVAYRRARGDDRLLAAARRFADLVVETFGPGGRNQICGHPEIEMALVELSRETGDGRYAELARDFIDRRGHGLLGEGRFGAAYYQDRIPFRQLSTVEGHAVRALYLGAGAVDAAVETGDRDLLEASRRQWRNMVAHKMYLTGGVGSRHNGESFGDDFELPADRAYCETCAAIGVAMWSWRLLLTELDGNVADIIERVLFNGLLPGVSQDGRAFNYVNPLHVRGEHPRQAWFEIACCPPNVMRTLASVEQYFVTETEDAVQLHQYANSKVSAGRGRTFTIDTDYPFGGTVTVTMEETTRAEWTLALRIPSWAEGASSVTVNGELEDAQIRKGYAEVRRPWRSGDVLVLDLAVAPRFTEADGYADAIQNCVAVERGPLVFCAESIDLQGEVSLDKVLVDTTSTAVDDIAGDDIVPLGVAIGIRLDSSAAGAPWPYRPVGARAEAHKTSEASTIRTVPYFAWGNRAPGGMRVWLRRDPARH